MSCILFPLLCTLREPALPYSVIRGEQDACRGRAGIPEIHDMNHEEILSEDIDH